MEKEITGKLAIYEILELFSQKNSQKLSLKIAIRDILEKCNTLQASTRSYFNDIIINLDNQIYNTNNPIYLEEMKKFKNDVDQYMDSYGNQEQEGNKDIDNNQMDNNNNDGNNYERKGNSNYIKDNSSKFGKNNSNLNSKERNYQRKQ